jgi:hypothetical protein
VLVCEQTALVTNNTVAPVDVPGLLFALTAGLRYYFKFKVIYQTDNAATGIGFCLSRPAMASERFSVQIQAAVGGAPFVFWASTDIMTNLLISAEVVAPNTDYEAVIEGFCSPTANGNLQLRVASEVALSQITIPNTGVGFGVYV